MPLKIKTAAAPAKATASKKVSKGESGGGARSAGKTLKMGVNQTWVHLFQENERCKAPDRRTDEEITSFLKKEFPDRHSKVFEAVSTVRSRYNRGVLTHGDKPKTQSNPYNKEEVPKVSKKSAK